MPSYTSRTKRPAPTLPPSTESGVSMVTVFPGAVSAESSSFASASLLTGKKPRPLLTPLAGLRRYFPAPHFTPAFLFGSTSP